jgi:hypothetical protein
MARSANIRSGVSKRTAAPAGARANNRGGNQAIGLDPGIHDGCYQEKLQRVHLLPLVMDCRVNPGNDPRRKQENNQKNAWMPVWARPRINA